MAELSLPAGSLQNALIALRNGADSVYFGLKEFSARSTAENFSEEDLSKIKEFSVKNNKKIYVTFNTLISDDNLNRAYKNLNLLSYYSPDGVIVQDLGIANLIKNDFNNLPLHASTQLACHSSEGVKELESLGFSRIVLSRELSFEEIKTIRNDCPNSDLKVFIHGAMCYGFSGLCMASFIKTGRSANEGSCAQICRTWFSDKENKKNFYPFSLKDLNTNTLVRSLDEIGINALKVEGRLKGPEYVKNVAIYYRKILDNVPLTKEDEENVYLSFLRESGKGYFNYSGPNHKNLNTTKIPSNMGKEHGKVLKVEKSSITLSEKVENHDGLMVIKKDKKGLSYPYQFPSVTRDGFRLNLNDTKNFSVGDTVYLLSKSDNNVKEPKTNLPLFKKEHEIKIEIKDDGLLINNVLYKIPFEEGNNSACLTKLIEVFSESGNANFRPKIELINSSSFKNPYAPLSKLKEIRRNAYSSIKPNRVNKEYIPSINNSSVFYPLPPRFQINSGLSPFTLDGVVIKGKTFFSFPPISFNEKDIWKKMEVNAKNAKNALIGLNNISQIRFAKMHPEFNYFIDIYLYLSNREAASLFQKEIPSLTSGYLWLERKEYISPWPFNPTIVTDFTPPLFISRSCYKHDSLGLDCKDCKKHYEYEIAQNNKSYIVVLDNCQTTLIEKK